MVYPLLVPFTRREVWEGRGGRVWIFNFLIHRVLLLEPPPRRNFSHSWRNSLEMLLLKFRFSFAYWNWSLSFFLRCLMFWCTTICNVADFEGKKNRCLTQYPRSAPKMRSAIIKDTPVQHSERRLKHFSSCSLLVNDHSTFFNEQQSTCRKSIQQTTFVDFSELLLRDRPLGK